MTLKSSERAAILAPQGRDAGIASAILREANVETKIVADLGELIATLDEGAGFAVLTEEALEGLSLVSLSEWIEGQEEWSDFPFVLLTKRGGGLERNPAAARYLELLGNATFLERPFHPTTLVSLAQAAVRGRRRQYEARSRLAELQHLAADLELRVKQRTAAHETAMAQLHEVQKIETLGQLTGGVAHDFNNLLTPITGALDIVHKQYAQSDPRAARLLGNALKAADRARILVQRLLGFARRQALQTQPTNIVRLINGMRDLIASSVGPTVEIKLKHDPEVPHASVDPNQLELAILNLCVNARDAMPDGGQLSIITRKVVVHPGEVPLVRPGDYVVLSVTDDGCGMSEATLGRAIEPFYSTKEIGRGTGLGLSMVHGLAAQLGGGFFIRSELGEGTTVELYLPTSAQDASDADQFATADPRSSLEQLSILLVDDEELVRFATAELIRDLGHEVTDLGSGFEALDYLRAGHQVDVVITDYKMPRMDGKELARRIVEIDPSIPVLIITGYTGISNQELNLPQLAKPFGQAEIAAALTQLLTDGDNVVRLIPKKSGA
ncbi:ATP-binding protein [Sphingomonas xanthus]|uniref:histidine kinase n=1 Tax=Sphingomonas xanthus TaxID=2594473 RepID=A0A516INM8_9SPHN|nr:ATP-binding protein [Sphingomonas xanthus]QDP18515.1 response regulator [Sphingomonas xanthus]